MERLTYKIAPEVVNHDAEDGANFQEVINKLGEYEDTGLTPERMSEIDKLYTEKCREVAELKMLYETTFSELEGLDDRNREYQAKIRLMERELQDTYKWLAVTSGKLPSDEVLALNIDGVMQVGYLKKREYSVVCECLPLVVPNIVAWMPKPGWSEVE